MISVINVWDDELQDYVGVSALKGEDGYTPVKGVDYFDGQDGLDGYTPQKGVDYFDGLDGLDGETPTIGENGNWYLGAADTGKPSRGIQGERGYSGLVPETSIPYTSAVEIAANTMTEIAELEGAVTVTLGTPAAGYDNEWAFCITQGDTAQTITLPTANWTLGIAPAFAANTTTIIRLFYAGDSLYGEWLVISNA